MSPGDLLTVVWNLIFIEPILNGLLILARFLGNSFGLAIVALTIVVRLLLLPLTLRQLKAAKTLSARMAILQPELKKLQSKYAKDRTRLGQETMKLYKEHGVNPMGCAGSMAWPMLIQMPIWLALYQAIIQALAVVPEGLLGLSQRLYPWLPMVYNILPLNNHFLWLDLAQPDSFYILPVLVGGSMWVQQRMTPTTTTDPQQKQMSAMMQNFMPLMFGFFTLSFPSGLAVYWVISNIIGIVQQYFVTGWGGLIPSRSQPAAVGAPPPAKGTPKLAPRPAPANTSPKEIDADGRGRGKRKNRRTSRSASPE